MTSWVVRLAHHVETKADAVALADPSCGITWLELSVRLHAWSTFLSRCGVLPHDRVLVLLEDGPVAWVALLAILAAGAVAVPVDTRLSAQDVQRICKTWQPVACLTSALSAPPGLLDQPGPVQWIDVDALPRRSRGYEPGKIELLPFAARGRVLLLGGPDGAYTATVDQILANGAAVTATLGYPTDLPGFLSLPLGHWGALVLGLALLERGQALWFSGTSEGELRLSIPNEAGPVICLATLRYWSQFSSQPEFPRLAGRIRHLVAIRGTARQALFRETLDLMPGTPFDILHGASHYLAISSFRVTEPPKPGCIGRPLPGTTIRVVRNHGCEAKPGRPGYLEIVTDPLAQRAWPDRHAAGEGWPEPAPELDIGWCDRNGSFFQLPRPLDMIRTGGRIISPSDLEQRVLDSGLVDDVLAFGVPHPALQEAVVLMAVPRPRITPRHVRAYCHEHLPAFMVPQRIELHPQLPVVAQAATGRAYLRLRYTGMFR